MTPPPNVLVIGGGPAGASCALRLRDHGLRVELAERLPFPRFKVCGCCLGAAGLRTLERIGYRQPIEAAAVALHRWLGSFNGRSVGVKLSGSVAISRERLDTLLLDEARRRGTIVHQPVSARIMAARHAGTDQQVTVAMRTARSETLQRFDAVVLASGLNTLSPVAADGMPWLPWIQAPHGPFGAGIDLLGSMPTGTSAEPMGEIEPGTVYMACGSHGYVGMVLLEDHRLDVAAALSPQQKKRRDANGRGGAGVIERVTETLARSGLPQPPLLGAQRLRSTGPLRRRRLAGRGRLLAVGDAAGYVEPFTGEGITWALRSGIAAADCIAARRRDLTMLGDHWAKQSQRLLRRRHARSSRIAWSVHQPALRSIAALALQRFPWLAQGILRTLEQSP